MSTPRFRHWQRTSGPKVLSGLLAGIGLLIMIATQFLRQGSSDKAFMAGMVLALAGITGLLTSKRTRPG